MKLNALASLGVATLLAVVGMNSASAQQPLEQNSTSPASPVQLAQMGQMGMRSGMGMPSGSFKAGEHRIQGRFSVVSRGGRRYVVLNQAFKTQAGPDLYVILHRSSTPPINGIRQRDYVSLGRLQKINGTQSYLIPANVNPNSFNSVVIWCRKFNANFGYASY